MKEKKFTLWLLKWSLLIVGIYLTVSVLLNIVQDYSLTEKSMNLTNEYLYFSDEDSFYLDELEFNMDNPDLISLHSVVLKDDGVYWTVEGKGNGAGEVFLEVTNSKTGVLLDSTLFRIDTKGRIIDMNTANFSHYREKQFCIMMLIIAFTILLWIGYFKSIRDLRFSYHSIFCIGLGIWLTLISINMIIGFATDIFMINLYTILASSPQIFIFYSFPVIILFAGLLSISNISLIRHEGFRFTNILGILLSVVMVAGFIILKIIDNMFYSGYEFFVDIWQSLMGMLYCIYLILECFLIGAIICGSRAAKNQPAYDKDYIVILGCMIKGDGTLYPLIRGRVDRAIRFYREQFEKTGKKAVFVPSGGRGSDEPISEGEAMKRYLMEQGIEEEQICAETNSINTRQNMEFSKEMIGENANVVFSTTNFHVFRSGIIAGQVDFPVDGMGSPTKWYFWPNAYIREVIGMISYKWKALVFIMIPVATFLTVIRFAF